MNKSKSRRLRANRFFGRAETAMAYAFGLACVAFWVALAVAVVPNALGNL